MKDARDIVKRPIITEKSYDLMNEGKFTFEVDKKANKSLPSGCVEGRD